MRIKALSLSGITRTGSKGIISASYDKAPQLKGYVRMKDEAMLYTIVPPFFGYKDTSGTVNFKI